MRLNGKKIYLDVIQETLIPVQQGWIKDEEVVRYGGMIKTKAQTVEEIVAHNKRLQTDENVRLFGIYLNNTMFESITDGNWSSVGETVWNRIDSNEYIGNIRLDIEWLWRVATVSLLIGKKEMWGQGIGTEAISLITDFAFDTLNMHKIEAGILEGNSASQKAFENAGFKEEGRKRGNRFLNGKHVDVILMGKINE
jgi:RimJ/RimL family protein N-acetyltransferase